MKEKTTALQPSGKAKTRKEIANELGVSTTTLWRKLKENNIILSSGLIYPSDQIRIYKYLGASEK
jgi:DNA invertase Pin-like site-specific DNA recombinase